MAAVVSPALDAASDGADNGGPDLTHKIVLFESAVRPTFRRGDECSAKGCLSALRRFFDIGRGRTSVGDNVTDVLGSGLPRVGQAETCFEFNLSMTQIVST